MRIKNDQGREFLVKILCEGDSYGLDKCLTHNEGERLVEFYDLTYANPEETKDKFGPEGQFVARYYVSTLLEDKGDCGLCLCGHEPVWNIDAKTMKKVRAFLLKNWLEETKAELSA